MSQRKTKKKTPPPRPPPPKFNNYRSKSTLNLVQPQQNLLEWSPPSSPKQEIKQVFGGSISSSYSSSASSLASSKKSFENDFAQSLFSWPNESKESSPNLLKPRIIRAQQAQITKIDKRTIQRDVSPPMPKIPPPSPPKDVLDVVTPYGIALYDFPATQPGDLPLQVDDVVILLRRVNEDWLYGKVGDLEGIFPQNFISVKVPLPEVNQIVTVLNEHIPYLPNMLALKPGQKVRIISEVPPGWLFGEIDGRTGHFPRSCVTFDL